MRRIRLMLLVSALAFTVTGTTPSDAITISVENYRVAVGQSQIYSVEGGMTWEYGNDGLYPSGSSFDGHPLAAGDILRINTTLNHPLVISDTSNTPELFRSFLMRFPDTRVDVSSIETSARVTLYNASGFPMGTYSDISSPATWPYVHFGGVSANRGLENIIGGSIVDSGRSTAVGGWLFELSVLNDPNGLLANSSWPWISFGFRADQIAVGNFADHVTVPEPSSLLLLAVGTGAILAFRKRLFVA